MTPHHVGIVVPAHDEEALIGACLTSVRDAVEVVASPGVSCRVVVVADACGDATAAVATTALGPGHDVIEVAARNVGTARAAGVGHLLARWRDVERRHIWLATTDADTVVGPAWLADQLALAAAGITAVAGIVRVDSFGEHPVGAEAALRATYDGPGDDHPHVHGANLGVRADTYVAAGGWPPVALAEDHGLWGAIVAGGWTTRATRSIVVSTSGRTRSRTTGGFADTLRTLVTPTEMRPVA